MFPMIARDLSVKVRQKQIIGPINLTINEGGITVLMGPNGAGKTTLLKALNGVTRLASGQVTFTSSSAKEAQTQQSFVFQSPIMLRRSVMENLAYPLMINGHDKKSAMNSARLWATKIGLDTHMERPAPFLSGGEKQKIALARALITSPKLLFLDEPTASLDGMATVEIEAMLCEAQQAGTVRSTPIAGLIHFLMPPPRKLHNNSSQEISYYDPYPSYADHNNMWCHTIQRRYDADGRDDLVQ